MCFFQKNKKKNKEYKDEIYNLIENLKKASNDLLFKENLNQLQNEYGSLYIPTNSVDEVKRNKELIEFLKEKITPLVSKKSFVQAKMMLESYKEGSLDSNLTKINLKIAAFDDELTQKKEKLQQLKTMPGNVSAVLYNQVTAEIKGILRQIQQLATANKSLAVSKALESAKNTGYDVIKMIPNETEQNILIKEVQGIDTSLNEVKERNDIAEKVLDGETLDLGGQQIEDIDTTIVHRDGDKINNPYIQPDILNDKKAVLSEIDDPNKIMAELQAAMDEISDEMDKEQAIIEKYSEALRYLLKERRGMTPANATLMDNQIKEFQSKMYIHKDRRKNFENRRDLLNNVYQMVGFVQNEKDNEKIDELLNSLNVLNLDKANIANDIREAREKRNKELADWKNVNDIIKKSTIDVESIHEMDDGEKEDVMNRFSSLEKEVGLSF